MKKLAYVLIFVLLAGLCSPAFAGGYTYTTETLSKYAGFVLDKASGEWTVSDPLFDAAMDMLTLSELRPTAAKSLCIGQVRLSGNVQTGTLRPEIELVYAGAKRLNIFAVSIDYGTNRLDAVAFPANAPAGECVRVPIADIALAREIFGAQKLTITLHGSEGVYTTTLPIAKPSDSRDAAENTLLSCDSLLAELPAMQAEDYALWTLSCAEWRALYGEEPRMQVTERGEMTMQGSKGEKVSALQSALASAGFYVGSKEQTFGKKTAAAVLRAQQFYGLVPTGAADGNLLALLEGGRTAQGPAADATELTWQDISSLSLHVERTFAAKRVFALKGDVLAGLRPADSSNCLVVLDTLVRAKGQSELSLGWQVTAELTLDGTVFPCTLHVECDEGTGFASTLLPLSLARLVIAAEVPQCAIESAESMEITVSCGGESMAFPIEF